MVEVMLIAEVAVILGPGCRTSPGNPTVICLPSQVTTSMPLCCRDSGIKVAFDVVQDSAPGRRRRHQGASVRLAPPSLKIFRVTKFSRAAPPSIREQAIRERYRAWHWKYPALSQAALPEVGFLGDHVQRSPGILSAVVSSPDNESIQWTIHDTSICNNRRSSCWPRRGIPWAE